MGIVFDFEIYIYVCVYVRVCVLPRKSLSKEGSDVLQNMYVYFSSDENGKLSNYGH